MKLTTPCGLSVIAVILLFGLAFAALPVHAQQSAQVSAQIGQAYIAVLNAEGNGGNVTSLVAKLNSAISLLQQADKINSTNPTQAQSLYSQASTLATQVVQASPATASAGKASVANAQVELVVETTILVGLAAVAYLYTPRIFWRIWFRTHRKWKVSKS